MYVHIGSGLELLTRWLEYEVQKQPKLVELRYTPVRIYFAELVSLEICTLIDHSTT